MVIFGLGNPGPRYVFSRHNAGFLYVDTVLHRSEILEEFEDRLFQAWRVSFNGGELYLVKPLSYMNRSGIAVKAFLNKEGFDLGSAMVVYDDVDLPLGRIRLRKRGSAGTHKGMASVLEALQTQKVKRMRIGIGPKPPELDMVEFVLGSFSDDELEVLARVMDVAVEATKMILIEGFDKAMSVYNASEVVAG